ncbi:MAG TPA: hypothetical protein VFT65_00895 [Candidatus Angelobacter sp.]|nr:hypothetical protein [Candidatus Angelobacter sp.]
MSQRASKKALAELKKSRELALDFIALFEHTGERDFATRSGALVQITVEDDFVCLHLKDECTQVGTCPKNHCPKLRGS